MPYPSFTDCTHSLFVATGLKRGEHCDGDEIELLKAILTSERLAFDLELSAPQVKMQARSLYLSAPFIVAGYLWKMTNEDPTDWVTDHSLMFTGLGLLMRSMYFLPKADKSPFNSESTSLADLLPENVTQDELTDCLEKLVSVEKETAVQDFLSSAEDFLKSYGEDQANTVLEAGFKAKMQKLLPKKPATPENVYNYLNQYKERISMALISIEAVKSQRTSGARSHGS
jgi:hypothetical protein